MMTARERQLFFWIGEVEYRFKELQKAYKAGDEELIKRCKRHHEIALRTLNELRCAIKRGI